MDYISTRGAAPVLNFEDTLLAGLASDGGLYVPKAWPSLDPAQLAAFENQSYQDVATQVIAPFVGDCITTSELSAIIDQAYRSFNHPAIAPLHHLHDHHYVLELFHGPTLAFKDVAMQLLALLMDRALTRKNRRATIVGATSGDTGGAAIEAFRGAEASDIFILYPRGRVSDVQRRQMTTPDEANVFAIAVDGTFDDCQALVKDMFNDAAFRNRVCLAGVNSINWVRVMAQTVYYFTAVAALHDAAQPVSFSVPTGNFGDIFAGYVAKQMGLPIHRLMIATNVNDILARTLDTGAYTMGEVVATSSPSMDIQISSNFERLLFDATERNAEMVCAYMAALKSDQSFKVTDHQLSFIRKFFAAHKVDQEQTAALIRQVYYDYGYLIDPHTAIGYGAALALEATGPIITLATAHPAKFPDAVHAVTEHYPAPPAVVAAMLERPERELSVPNKLSDVQDFITAHSRVTAA